MGTAVLSKQSGVFAVLLLPGSLVYFDWSAERRRERLARWVGCVAVALVLMFLIYALQYLSPMAYLPVVENHRLLGDALRHPLMYLRESSGPYFRAFVGYLTVPLLIPAIRDFRAPV